MTKIYKKCLIFDYVRLILAKNYDNFNKFVQLINRNYGNEKIYCYRFNRYGFRLCLL